MKDGVMFIRVLLPKPFVYLERRGCRTVKDKLGARVSMTYREYVVGFIKMILDERWVAPGTGEC